LGLLPSGLSVEAAGIAPASREASARASTCVADPLIVGVGAPIGGVPFGLARHEFSLGLNKRFGLGDPELASLAGSLGRRLVAGPSLFFRQRDGDQQCCWQLKFGRLFTRPADQPRHATFRFGHPVDPGSPPDLEGVDVRHGESQARRLSRSIILHTTSGSRRFIGRRHSEIRPVRGGGVTGALSLGTVRVYDGPGRIGV